MLGGGPGNPDASRWRAERGTSAAQPVIVARELLFGPRYERVIVEREIHEMKEGLADVPRRRRIDFQAITFWVAQADGPLVALEDGGGPGAIETTERRIRGHGSPAAAKSRQVGNLECDVMRMAAGGSGAADPIRAS